MKKEKNKRCLICVDLQNDFCVGGSLAVPNANEIIPVINNLLTKFDLIIFTKDWHPANHKSFASQHRKKNVFDVIELNGLSQVLWPDHCVQQTKGSELHKEIQFNNISNGAKFYIFKKGMDRNVDSYSAFFDNGKRHSTNLGEFLRERGVTDTYITGLALDYCVKFTAIDAKSLGFNTIVIKDACKGIDLDPQKTYEEFTKLGIDLVTSEMI